MRRVDRPADWAKEFACWNCAALWEVEISDLYAYNEVKKWPSAEWNPQIGFNCGACLRTVSVTGKVPHSIERDLIRSLRDAHGVPLRQAQRKENA